MIGEEREGERREGEDRKREGKGGRGGERPNSTGWPGTTSPALVQVEELT